MARLALNKNSLHRKTRALHTYERFLPALELKRRSLIAQRNQARVQLASIRGELSALLAQVGHEIPMLSLPRDLAGSSQCPTCI